MSQSKSPSNKVEVVNLYEAISDLARDDSTVYSYLRIQQGAGMSDLEVATQLIRTLVTEKKAYFDYAKRICDMSTIPIRPIGEIK